MCKGADSIIQPLLAKDSKNIDKTLEYLEDFAKEGLRTLLLAEKEIDRKFYKKWHSKYKKAAATIMNREEAQEKVA